MRPRLVRRVDLRRTGVIPHRLDPVRDAERTNADKDGHQPGACNVAHARPAVAYRPHSRRYSPRHLTSFHHGRLAIGH